MTLVRRPAPWLWAERDNAVSAATRDLPTILRAWRRATGLSQERAGALLGYDKTYISMIETGRRAITDVRSRRHIARVLGLPAYALGITESDDADVAAMLQFADSAIRLATLSRQTGQAADAAAELWPLVARLEARAAEGRIDRATAALLGRGRTELGVALGTILPEERLPTAARWTGGGVRVAERIGEIDVLANSLTMHGNELRKAGHVKAAVVRLQHAATVAVSPESRGAALILLARAAGELGVAPVFDEALCAYRRLLDSHAGETMLFNPFTAWEVELRGLLAIGRTDLAVRRADAGPPSAAGPVAPQWTVIERVTAGTVLASVGDVSGANDVLNEAIRAATRHRLPHQVQRAIRAARSCGLDEVAASGAAAVASLITALDR